MATTEGEPKAAPVFKGMVVIVDEADGERLSLFLRDRLVKLQYAFVGEGTADSDLQALLGFTGVHKCVSFSLLPDFHAEELMRLMPEQLDLRKRGKGIAFTLPLSGMCLQVLNLFDEDILTRTAAFAGYGSAEDARAALRRVKEEANPMSTEPVKAEVMRHELIVAVVNHGCSEEVMTTAKAHGAGGGTLLNARRTGLSEDAAFLGVPIQRQKEAVMILTEQKQKAILMKAIHHEFGLHTPAHGIIFSLPVDSVAGLHSLNGTHNAPQG